MKQVQFRCSEEFYEKLKIAATNNEMKVVEYIRIAISEEIEENNEQ